MHLAWVLTCAVDCTTGASRPSVGWQSFAPPECGSVIASWNDLDAYSNGGAGARCDASGSRAEWHRTSSGRFAYGRAWDACELVNRYYQTHYDTIEPIVGANAVERCRNARRTKGDYSVHFVGIDAPSEQATNQGTDGAATTVEPVGGDALVWTGHIALVTDNDADRVFFIQQNWETASGFAATDTVSWSRARGFGAQGTAGSYGQPTCWIHPARTPAPRGREPSGRRGAALAPSADRPTETRGAEPAP